MRAPLACRRAATWEFLTPDQAADVDAIAAQIIPTDDLPGAREAGVVHFVDHSLATWGQDQRDPFAQGLDELNRRRADSAGPERAALPRSPPLARSSCCARPRRRRSFKMIRFVTVAGTFANPSWGGNRDHIGWRILGFEDRFAGSRRSATTTPPGAEGKK